MDRHPHPPQDSRIHFVLIEQPSFANPAPSPGFFFFHHTRPRKVGESGPDESFLTHNSNGTGFLRASRSSALGIPSGKARRSSSILRIIVGMETNGGNPLCSETGNSKSRPSPASMAEDSEERFVDFAGSIFEE
jgi:hypothetical protein